MKPFNRLLPLVVLLVAGLGQAPATLAATCTSVAAGGNWNVTGTWTGCAGGNGTPVNTPGSADTVVINAAGTVTLAANAAASSISINAATAANGINLAGFTLNVGGAVTMNAPSTNGITSTLNVGSGTLTATSLSIAGGAGSRVALATISTGTITTSGSITFSGTAANARFTSSGASTVNVGGNFGGGGTLTTSGTGTINFSGNAAQSIGAYATYNNISINNNTGVVTLLGAITYGGALSINGSGTLDDAGNQITGAAAGTLSMASGTNLKLAAAFPANLVKANIALNSGSTVTYQANAAQTISATPNYGNLLLAPTITNNRTYTFAAGAVTVNGNFAVNPTSTAARTLTVSMGGAITVATANTTTIQGSGTGPATGLLDTTAANNYALTTGNLVVGTNGSLTSNASSITLKGTTGTLFTRTGTFTQGTSTVTVNTTASVALNSGTITFSGLTMNSASTTATLGASITVNGALTMTAGNISTGVNSVTLGTTGTASSSPASYIVGAVTKTYSAAGTLTFPIGDVSNYTPVTITGTAGFTAGTLTVTTTGGADHPNIATSQIVSISSVNRYWTLTPSGLPGTSTYTATFNYISPSDYDGGAVPASFVVERWSGSLWFPTTLTGACSTTQCQISGQTTFGDFAIGDPAAGFDGTPGAFNVFETTTSSGSVLGRLYTKRLGAGTFAVSIVAVSNNAVNAAPSTNALTVDIIDASSTGGTLTGTSNCRTTWTTVIQTQTVASPVGWSSGRVNVNITVPTQAVRNARIRVTQGGNIGCSTDNFAIRPQAFTITSSSATGGTAASQTDSSGTPVIKTGSLFNLTATAVTGYDGTPSVDNTTGKVVGSPNAGTILGSFGAGGAVTPGVASGDSFVYSEVGNFGLSPDAVLDASFASVDQSVGDCVASSTSNTLSGGQYGCSIGSNAVPLNVAPSGSGGSGFGRFIPDHFDVAYNTPTIAAACGTFTYIGSKFKYTVAPQLTVTARSGGSNGLTDATTKNYAGSYAKLANTSGSLNQAPYDSQGGRYSRFDAGSTPALDTSGLPATTADPAIGTFTNGQGTLSFDSGSGTGSGLSFTRSTTTASAPFNADIALKLNVIDSDGVAFGANPAAFGSVAAAGNGIAFSSGNKEMRFGRLRLGNANGSPLIAATVQMEAQYWNGTSFITNTADSCTSVAAANIAMGSYTGNLTDSPKCLTAVSGGGTLISGRKTLSLAAPGGGINGGVTLTASLGASAIGNICLTVGSAPGADTPLNLPYLQGNWTGSTFTQNPFSRSTFGVYRGSEDLIYLREN